MWLIVSGEGAQGKKIIPGTKQKLYSLKIMDRYSQTLRSQVVTAALYLPKFNCSVNNWEKVRANLTKWLSSRKSFTDLLIYATCQRQMTISREGESPETLIPTVGVMSNVLSKANPQVPADFFIAPQTHAGNQPCLLWIIDLASYPQSVFHLFIQLYDGPCLVHTFTLYRALLCNSK